MTTRICLNMIVKNEAHVIRRCLDSVKPFIDRWVIVDTGSTDGTQDIIRSHMAGIAGQLHERPWKSFGHNRTEALQLARDQADYLLFIDADEALRAPEGFTWPELSADAYYLHAEFAGMVYSRGSVISTRLDWKWVGVLHEYLESTPPATFTQLEWPRIVIAHDGARARDPKTYEKDAALLEAALREDPDNLRNIFYLAQSYRDAGLVERARQTYARRAAMGGWDEEVWYSLYQVGRLVERMKAPAGEVQAAYLAAFRYRPQRAEPLCDLARYHRERDEHALAWLFARTAAAIPRPKDILFVDDDVYRWRALDELAVAAWWAGQRDESRDAMARLIAAPDIPPDHRARIEANLLFYDGSG
jgi:glycosyltransferase involved in cell wall biosynthesis